MNMIRLKVLFLCMINGLSYGAHPFGLCGQTNVIDTAMMSHPDGIGLEDILNSYLFANAPRDRRDADWLTNVVESAGMPSCNNLQSIFYLGKELQRLYGDVSVSLDCTPPKISFFVSDAAATLTNGINAEIESLLAWGGATITNKPSHNGVDRFPWTPGIKNASEIKGGFMIAKSLVDCVAVFFPNGYDVREKNIVFNVYPRELYVVEYARQIGIGCDTITGILLPYSVAYGRLFVFERRAYPDRIFIVSAPQTHVAAWSMLKMYDVAAPAWIAEIERITRLGYEK